MSDQQFDGSITHESDCVVVALSGEVDMASTVPFGALAAQALTASPNVVFDMADVTFIDSSGLRGIIEVYRQVGGAGSVTVRNASDRIVKVLQISGLESILTVEGL